METKTRVLVDNLRFPEEPRWHAGKLWFSDLFTQRVMTVDPEGRLETVVELPDTPSGLGFTPEGHLLIVSAAERRLLRMEEDALIEVADVSSLVDYPCNEIVVDEQGRAYIGNLGYNMGDPGAAPKQAPILLITPEDVPMDGPLGGSFGNARIVATGLAFPNGMAITPEGGTLIVAESHGARLTAFTILPDGSLSQRRVWAQFGGETAEDLVTPDGICLDAEGALWVASPNTREVLRVLEGAVITDRIPLETIPLACMLGGPERKTLFIPSTESLNPYEDESGGRIETIDVDVPGAGRP